jgi:hypothetical protein
VLDVPASRHIDVVAHDWGLTGNPIIGGEPRGLQIFADEGHPQQLIGDAALPGDDERVWHERMTEQTWVVSPEELVAAGVWGSMSIEVRRRAGELIVIPKYDDALYDARAPRADARDMVGQHGGLSEREMLIPWMRLTTALGAK